MLLTAIALYPKELLGHQPKRPELGVPQRGHRPREEPGLNIVWHAHGATGASPGLETAPGFVLLLAEDNGAGLIPDLATSPSPG